MSRQINANFSTPRHRVSAGALSRRSSGAARRLSYSPEDEAVPLRRPDPAPRRSAPMPAPRRNRSPVRHPTQSPTQRSASSPAPRSSQPGDEAHQRALRLHESIQDEILPYRSPDYSPVRNSEAFIIDSDDEFEPDFDSDVEIQEVRPEKEITLMCNICSCSFTDLENRNSSFVTSTQCDHAVCIKCYLKIIFSKESYKCSICNRETDCCRMYTETGIQEIKAVNARSDKEAIKKHWGFLRKDNMADKTIELNAIQKLQAELVQLRAETTRAHHNVHMIKSDNQMLKQQLEFKDLELKRESEKRLKLQDDINLITTDHNLITSKNRKLTQLLESKESYNQTLEKELRLKDLELQRECQNVLKLQEENNTLTKATKNLQSQLDAQIAETKLKMEMFAQQHNILMEKFKNSL
ncbi:immediate early protein 2 [Anticarsia gemmatalis nucleopolyhedrovirus]|nr:immediate early protein 2 [Anticarsia gemmatalis nucleopolyhedrovirus]ABI13928.2 immediate early protein 2 [Anticarsia gemmatalis multiple nucleopolyhedrovirus]ALR71234.1 immediate early protein 2 [Anticarsia gemmatalis multiple nucleopolyhedrovirus]ALR71392.1 immediate early protein 2 [Anticarsia gemmatalis multiple nucleopolyhedrovirus]